MSEYDDLERQLRDRVRELDPAPRAARRDLRRGPVAPGPGRPRRFRGRRLLALVAVPVLLTGGAAAATGIVGGDPRTQDRAERLAIQAVVRTFRAPACGRSEQPAPPVDEARLIDGDASGKTLRLLPALGPTAPGRLSDPQIRAVVPPGIASAGIVRSSVRVARFPDGGRVVAFATYGSIFAPTDPAACTARRKARLLDDRRAAGKPTGDAVTTKALYLLDHQGDTDPRAPSLQIVDTPTAGGGSGSASAPLGPGRQLRPGPLLTGGDGKGGKRFVGIAAPGATSVAVRAAPGSPRSASARRARVVARDAPVVSGLFAFSELRRGSGHLVIEHRAKDGRVLLRRRLQ